MLGYFPIPYPDELLYSVIARYAIHLGIHSDKALVQEIFLSRNVAAVVDFPGHIITLVKQINHISHFSPQDWIQHHTLYPAYLAFEPPERCEQIFQSACSNKAGDIHTRIGIAASSISSPKYLRICKKCYVEQLQTYGEVYWQRTLQMSGVIMCPFHEEALFSTNIPQHPVSKFSFTPAEKLSITGQIDLFGMNILRPKLIRLARNFFELLNYPYTSIINFDQLSNYYHHLAEQNRLIKGNRVNHTAVAEKFIKYWTLDCLKRLDPSLVPVERWLRLLFLKQRKAFHPLYHLLVWQSFDVLSPSTTLNIISKLPQIRMPTSNPVVETPSVLHQQERKKWLNHCKHNPRKGVKWLRSEGNAGANYAWLYRHDWTWLQSHLPKRLKPNQNNNRIDWSTRDREILIMLRKLKNETILELLDTRMSKTWFIKHIDAKCALEKHLNKLPLCKVFIDKHSETVEHFQQRRIVATIADLRMSNTSLSLWTILRKAGIRKSFVNEDLINFIKNNQGNV